MSKINGRRKNRTIFVIAMLSLPIIAVELSSLFVLKAVLPDSLLVTSRVLKGDKTIHTQFQNSIGQSFLHYIPAPNFSIGKDYQHNAQGYRGKAVPFDKEPGTYRILFLGGSTTYGWAVKDSEKTWPALAGKLLNENLPRGINKVEVINGGLPWGTSAELFTHYHFKYHYYRPDMVVINSGCNDAGEMAAQFYHPDYSHTRLNLPRSKPLSSFAQVVMTSPTINLFVLALFHEYGVPEQLPFTDLNPKNPPPAKWYPRMILQSAAKPGFPNYRIEENAFHHNIKQLVTQVKADGAMPVLLEFRENPYWRNHWKGHLAGFRVLRRLLREMARDLEVPYVEFPRDLIPQDNWVDNYHLTEEGVLKKAQLLVRKTRGLMALED